MSDECIASRLRNSLERNKTIINTNNNNNNQQKKSKTNNKLNKRLESISNRFKSNLTINDLNDDVFEHILSYLPIIDKIRSETVSKRWQLLINGLLRKQTAIGMKNIAYNRSDCTLIDRHFVKDDIIDRAIFVFNASIDSNEELSYCDLRNAIQRNHNECAHNLKSIFSKCPKILSLDLRSIELNEILVDLIADYCPKLECLHLNSMVVSDSVWNALSSRFSKRLIHLTIRNSIKSNQELIVQKFIKSCKCLNTLKVTEWTPEVKGKWFENISATVDEVHIACTSAVNVFKNVNNRSTNHIKRLKLSTFEALPQSVIDSIGHNFHNLTQINLRNCEGFGKRSYQPIACLTQLQELKIDLPFANCDEDFALMCQKCTQMKSIELNFGLLTISSLQTIGKYWSQLESISFRFVTIEKLNSDALLVLKSLKCLRKLNLHGTNISDDICEVLQSSSSLRYLNLDLCTLISRSVVQQFIHSSKVKPKELFELSIKETKIHKMKNFKNALIISDGIIRLNNLFIYYTTEEL